MPTRRTSAGFTLIELIVVIAIIGIIAALLVPDLLDSLQKAKQKQTMGQITTVGTAMMAWLTDQAGAAAAAGASATPIDLTPIPLATQAELEAILVPTYIQAVPERDGWAGPIEYRFNDVNPYGVRILSIRSFGRDQAAEGTAYVPGRFDPTDYDRDLVWVDGGFVRFPLRASS